MSESVAADLRQIWKTSLMGGRVTDEEQEIRIPLGRTCLVPAVKRNQMP